MHALICEPMSVLLCACALVTPPLDLFSYSGTNGCLSLLAYGSVSFFFMYVFHSSPHGLLSVLGCTYVLRVYASTGLHVCGHARVCMHVSIWVGQGSGGGGEGEGGGAVSVTVCLYKICLSHDRKTPRVSFLSYC